MAAKGLHITSTDGGFKVQGIENTLYPDNAVLTYPANSVIMVLDDSDIVTFRSAANNDVLFSGKINHITIDGARATKDNIVELFGDAANKPMGEGGDITGLFADVDYDSTSKEIIFYDRDGNDVASIDATDFIKDGMVSNVEISNGNLVITFNTDAGQEPISIPLTDIFNPANYYDKTAMDAALALKADASSVYTKSEADGKFLTEHQSLADYPTIETMNTALGQKANSADLATVATSGSYNDLTDKPTIPTNVSAFTNDAGYLTNSDISSLEPYSIDLDALIANGVTSTQYDGIATASADGRVIKATYDGRKYTVESVYVDGDVMKLTLSDELKHRFFQLTKTTGTVSPTTAEYVSLVEKGIWNTKQPLLVSGTNIKTINNESILGEGNIEIQGGVEQVQSDWNQTDDTAVDYIKNKPAIPAAQVNSDWNASSGVAQILNKPDLSIYAQSSTLATVATSGDYNDLTKKPTIPVVPTNVSAFTNDAGYLTERQSHSYYYTKRETDEALNGKQDTLLFYTEEDNTQEGLKNATIETVIKDTENGITKSAYIQSHTDDVTPYAELYVYTEVNNSEEAYIKSADIYADSEEGAFLNYHTQDNNENTYYDAQLNINADGISLRADNGEDTVSFNVTSEGVDIDGDAVVTESALADKQDTLTAGTGIDITNNVISATGGTQVQSDWNQSDSSAVDYIKNKPAIPDTSDFVTKAEYNPKELAIAEALTDLNENKADKTEIPDVSTLATKTELNAKQDTLVSGTNIKTINNESILGEGNITIEASGGGMDEDTELLISSALVDLNDRKIDATDVKENYQKKGDYATNTDLALKANSADVPTLADYEEAQKITSWSLNDLNKNKADKSELPDISNYYTKTEIDTMVGNINTILASI